MASTRRTSTPIILGSLSAEPGNLTIAGEANSQDIDVSGAGSYLAANLESEEAEIDLSGVGDAIVNVSNNLDVRIDGLGSVEYIGKPYH